MSIAIIVATHKESARALLESSEMICGKQDNIAAVDFYETEDVQSLKNKYLETIQQLDTDQGILFLVDLFGGTPFNAAYLLAKERKDVQVVAGLNLPMLLEAVMSREIMGLEELVEDVKQTAIEGVKSAAVSVTQEDDE